MASREYSSDKRLRVDVQGGERVTLELNVKVTFMLPLPIGAAQEIRNFTRLMDSDLRQRGAEELEETWRGLEDEAPALDGAAPGDPEKGDPALDIDEATEPTPVPAAPTSQPAEVDPPPFSSHRRGQGVARTTQQQIVLHLEGPRYGFDPARRAERLAFTAWLSEVPGLTLTSTNDLNADQALKVLRRLNRETNPAEVLAEWHVSRPVPPHQPNPSIIDEPLGF